MQHFYCTLLLNANSCSWRFCSYLSIFLEASNAKWLVQAESLQGVWLETAYWYCRQHIGTAWQSNVLFKHWKGGEIVFEWMEKESQKRKTSVQTITTRKLKEKNEVQTLGGIPNRSPPHYLSAAHRPSSSRKSNLLRGSDQTDRARQMIRCAL